MYHDVDKLERSLTEIGELCSRIGDRSHTEEMMKIIRRPGYTTPAEWTFTLGLVDGLKTQANAFLELRNALLHGAREVGAVSAKTAN